MLGVVHECAVAMTRVLLFLCLFSVQCRCSVAPRVAIVTLQTDCSATCDAMSNGNILRDMRELPRLIGY